MAVKVFISHTDEDIQRCAPLLRTLDAWQISYYFDAVDRRSAQNLSQETQQALVECEILLRICTRFTARSYWMSIEVGAFLSLQADDHKANQSERHKMVNLVLDAAYAPEPFDITATGVDATNSRWPGWVNDLRRALDLPPIQDIARIAHDITSPPAEGISRRAALGLGAAGVVAIAAGGVSVFWLARSRAPHTTTTMGLTPTPPSRDSRLRWSFYARDTNEQITGGSSISGAVAVEGNTIYAATQLGMVYAISTSGEQLWRYSVQQAAAIYQRPVVANNVVYVSAKNAGVMAIQNGARLWFDSSPGFTFSIPVLANDRLYVNGFQENLVSVTALDPTSGAVLVNYALKSFSVPTSGVAVTGNLLVFGAENGYLFALDATNPKSPVRWRADTGATRQVNAGGATEYYVSALPTVADGVIYAGSTDSHLYAIDVATGARRWAFATGGGSVFRPPLCQMASSM